MMKPTERLPRTKVTDQGLKLLSSLPTLGYLDLSMTEVTDRGLTHLTNIRVLHNVDLSFTKVTDKGIADLRKEAPVIFVTR